MLTVITGRQKTPDAGTAKAKLNDKRLVNSISKSSGSRKAICFISSEL